MILRDYWCPYCHKGVEMFDDDNNGICPNCGSDGLQQVISAPKIKTSHKSSSAPSGLATGTAFHVQDGQVIGCTPLSAGAKMEIKDGQQCILALRRPPDPEQLQIMAKALSKKPDKNNNKTVH